MKVIKLVLALGCVFVSMIAARSMFGMYLFLMDSTEGRTPYMFGALAGTVFVALLSVAGAIRLARSAMHRGPSGETSG